MDDRTEWDRMLAGEPYDGAAPVFVAARARASVLKAEVDAIPAGDMAARVAALGRLFGAVEGPCVVMPPFDVEYGTQVRLGPWVFVNAGALFLDCAPITLEERATIGPRVMFLTATHPVRPEERFRPADPDRFPPFKPVTLARPIKVGRAAWIGAGSILLPGVTVGEGTVVGAGSVVTRSLPARVVAAGNPARVLHSVDDPG